MRLMVIEENEHKERVPRRYRSWGHYRNAKGYVYPEPPIIEDTEVQLIEVPCGFCWGQGYYKTLAQNGEGYVDRQCPSCIGTRFSIIIPV